MGYKKAFIFSLDALIVTGILIMLAVFLAGFSFTHSSPELKYQRLYYAAKDITNILNKIKISSLQGYGSIQSLISEGFLTEDDLNKSLMDVIGTLWSNGSIEEARNVTKEILDDLLNSTPYSYGIWMENELVYERNLSLPHYISKLSTIVSGYTTGKPASGFAVRAYLTRANKVFSKHVYFGGYVGEGNVSKRFVLPEYDNIVEACMEMSTGSNFTLYINGNFSGVYNKTAAGNMSADKFAIPESFYQWFVPGNNTILFVFSDPQNNYIGGGYVKIRYNTSNLTEGSRYGENVTDKYNFPGINGVINLYSSLYVPGKLINMSVLLHYNSSYTVFLSIGNITVYEDNSTGETYVEINNSELSSLLDYGTIEKKTTPLRMGLRNATYMTTGGEGKGDVILDTDVSGSMRDCMDSYADYYTGQLICRYNCFFGGPKSCPVNDPSECTDNVCGGFCWWPYGHCSVTKLDFAKEADKAFVDTVLNVSGNRVGLVSYSSNVVSTEDLTNDTQTLYNEIDSYYASGSTCICCGILRSTNMINAQSNETRRRAMVIMTDGEANVRCDNADHDMDGDSDVDAKDDTIKAACDAWNLYNITVYTVGFGEPGDVDENTLQLTAQCGNGSYYFVNASELAETFEEIANEFVNASYVAQTVVIQGNVSGINRLFDDSYISYTYTPEIEPPAYGEVTLVLESVPFGNQSGEELITDNETGTKEGWFYVPNGSEIIDTQVTSYSSSFWTDRLYVKNSSSENFTRIYWLGDYSQQNYTRLGDPFIINIPVTYISQGNNSVKIGTGLVPENGTGGSPDDRVVYTIRIPGITLEGYSKVFPKAKGSSVTVYYDIDGDDIYDDFSAISYGPEPDDIFDPDNDSVDDAFMRLMNDLNFVYDKNPDSYGNGSLENPYDGINSTNPIDLQITSEIEFDTLTVADVPSMWGPSRLETRVWI